jgi:hypothetical protein
MTKLRPVAHLGMSGGGWTELETRAFRAGLTLSVGPPGLTSMAILQDMSFSAACEAAPFVQRVFGCLFSHL